MVDENTKDITSQSDLRFSNIDIFNIKSTTYIEWSFCKFIIDISS